MAVEKGRFEGVKRIERDIFGKTKFQATIGVDRAYMPKIVKRPDADLLQPGESLRADISEFPHGRSRYVECGSTMAPMTTVG